MEKIAIITNSYRRPWPLVQRSLEASLKQCGGGIDLFFIDQNDDTKVPEQILNRKNFYYIKSSEKCVSNARNSFSSARDYEWYLFCDDDGFLDESYLSKLLKLMASHPQVKIFAGSIMRDDGKGAYSPRHEMGGNLNHFFSTKLLMGSNLVVERETFVKLGKFNEKFGAGSFWGSGEETDFAWKAYFAKVPMLFAKELIVWHVPPYHLDIAHSMKKAYYYGIGKGALVSMWLFKYRKIIVLFEFFEMFLVPLILILKSLFTFNFKLALASLSSIFGRFHGLILYLCPLNKFKN